MKSINLTIPGLSSDQWEWVDAERVRYLGDVEDFAHVGPNEFGSSIGGSTVTLDDQEGFIEDENDLNGGGDDENHFQFQANIEINLSDDENDVFNPPPGYHDDDDNFLM